MKTINLLTPSNYGVPVEVAPLREEGLHQQREQVEALDEEPEVVGHDAVMEENHHCFTAHLHGRSTRPQECIQVQIFSCWTLLKASFVEQVPC